ncbi:MAG: M60 family peptidase N-terminal accessory domain-containing protein [Verrucomicrobiota bacterium]
MLQTYARILIRSIAIAVVCICLSTLSRAELLVDLDFDENILDAASGYTPSFVIDEVVEDASFLNYISGRSDQAVSLGYRNGFVLPNDLTSELFSSQVWAFQMRFKITGWGEGDGSRMLINIKRRGTNTPPFFRLETVKLDDVTGQLSLRIRSEQDLRLSAFEFGLNEWTEFIFIIDFEQGYYSIYNDSFYVNQILDDFDYDYFKTEGNNSRLELQDFHIGYFQNITELHNSVNDSLNSQYSAALAIDSLKIYNASVDGNQAVFENAISRLTAHLEGSLTLAESEISDYSAQALANHQGRYADSKVEIDAYFAAYEAAYEPMFTHTDFVDFYTYYDAFGQVMLFVQLDVFDNFVNTENIALVDSLVFEAHEAFPGPVADAAERLDDAVVTVDGTYVADPGYNKKVLVADYGAFARRGTGLYAPPGEVVTVEVPNELVGIGAQVVVGTHTHDVSNKMDKLRRFPRIFKEFPIEANQTSVVNPFGGVLYITIPEGSEFGPIEVIFSGAVKFAYFPMNETNVGDLPDFQSRVASGEVLWAEVETENFMFTGPTEFFKRDDIVETLEMWDRMWEAYQLYNGRPYPLHKAEHLAIDKMTKFGTLAGGYPMISQRATAPFIPESDRDLGINMMNVLDFEGAIQDSKVTYWHEMSHHTGLPTLGNEQECIVGLAYVAVFNAGWGMEIDDAMQFSERQRRTRSQALVDWIVMDNFLNNAEMTSEERQYQQRGWAKYVDIAMLFGWDGLGAVNKVFYDQWTDIGGQINDPEINVITDSELILASCQALNANVAPLYHFWGEHPEVSILDQVNGYPRSLEIYQHLRAIRDFIPRSLEEFQPYFDDLFPDNENRQNHFPYLDAFADWEGTSERVLAQIDLVLELYYGSDFDEDGISFLLDEDDTNAAIGESANPYILWAQVWGVGDADSDADEDTWTNLVEYGLAGNPRDSQDRGDLPKLFQENDGLVFRHLKRKDDSSLVYQIETSSDLSPDSWSEAFLSPFETMAYDDAYDELFYTIPMTEDAQFIRLSIEQE